MDIGINGRPTYWGINSTKPISIQITKGGFVVNIDFKITHGTLAVGDRIHFLGHTTEYETTVHSMQIEHQSVTMAKKGDSVGVKVPEKVREGDKVYKILADQLSGGK